MKLLFFKFYPIQKHTFLCLLILFFSKASIAQPTVKSIVPEPIPSWVKPYPKPTLKNDYDLDLVLLHDEEQLNHVTGEHFVRRFYFVNKPKGINQIQGFTTDFEPEFQSFHFHRLAIHRNKKVINLGENLHAEYWYHGKQINGEHYTDDLTVELFFKKVTVEDVLEIAYTTKGKQPDLKNMLSFYDAIPIEKFVGKKYIRVLTYPEEKIHYSPLNLNPKISKQHNSQYSIVEVEETVDEKLKPITGPDWYEKARGVYFTSNDSWKNYIEVNLENFQLEKSPSAEVKEKVFELVEETDSKMVKIKKILDYLSTEITYLDYDLINPKRPKDVIRQNVGDCKSKTLLAIKMLECIDIESWPVIVYSEGFDERLMSTFSGPVFNHAILEYVVEEDTLLFDGTDDPQFGSIYDYTVKDFRYGLRLKKGNDRMTKLEYNDNSKLTFNTTITPYYDEGSNLVYETNREVHFYGRIANKSIKVNKYSGTNGVLNDFIGGSIKASNCSRWSSNNEKEGVEKFTFNETKPYAKLEQQFNRCNKLMEVSAGIFSAKPDPLHSWMSNLNFQSGGEYFSLPDFVESEFNYKYIMYDSTAYTPDTFHFEKDWIKFSKKTWQVEDTIFAHFYFKPLKPFLPSARRIEVSEGFDEIYQRLDVLLDKAKVKVKTEEDSSKVIAQIYRMVSLLFLVLIAFAVYKLISVLDARRVKIKELEEELSKMKKE